MTNELNRCMKKLELFEADAEKVKQLINEAGPNFLVWHALRRTIARTLNGSSNGSEDNLPF